MSLSIQSRSYQTGVGIAFLTSILTVWMTIVRDDGTGTGSFMVILAAAVAAFAAWFRPAGMARAMAAGLVDRVQVTLFPVITGQTGLDPIFQGAADFDLELLETRTLDRNIQELTYRPTLHSTVKSVHTP